jgi:group II intron reverse transcriptase/maturase
MSLETPETVRKLQAALHAKAKGSPDFRFYSLYDKIHREDILTFAYRRCKANGGAPGVDEESFQEIASYGEERWLGELAEELRKKAYRPQAIRRVYIPKPNGEQRPLGIPTIRDRVVQTATVVVLEPIFEPDLQPEQHAYRPNRSALDAVRRVHALVNQGHGDVVDADLSGYFDSVPHGELMKSVSRRISDGQVLRLIKRWLTAPVEETDERGGKHRRTRSKDTGRGTPQGAPISPLLSNIYMRRFVLGWKVLGHEARLDAHIVNYADDFVICCRGTGQEADQVMRQMMASLKLTVNEKKTQRRRMPADQLDFLGYTIGRCCSRRTGRSYIGTRPSKRKVQSVCRRVSEATRRGTLLLSVSEQIERLNRLLRGWANYFCLGPVSPAYRAVDRHTEHRLRRWLCGKHKISGKGTTRYTTESLYERLGLIRLSSTTASLPWANT